TFDPIVFATPTTILLGGTQLELSDATGTVAITGPPAGVSVSGGGESRAVPIDPGVTAAISGLTITGGSDTFGGGIINFGTLTVTKSTISGNIASASGGGIQNLNTLVVTGCNVEDNTATSGGGINNGDGTFPNSFTLTVSNST